MSDAGDLLDALTMRTLRNERRIDALERLESGAWRGASAVDFTTATLPNFGDYGYQSVTDELQMNVSGVIRSLALV